MPRKKEALTLSVPPGTKEQLEAIARRLGIFWGKSPSPSGLIAAIAQQQLEVGQPFTLSQVQVQSLQQAIKALIDAGHIRDAEIVAALVLERGNLNNKDRPALMQQVSQFTEAWRTRTDQLIKEEQPFRLLYCKRPEEELEYTVRYAEVSFEEKRFYLNIWCEETEDIKDTEFPELIHNRCLRFDRIKAIVPTSGEWRGCLDFIEVYLHFHGGMVKAYEERQGKDISNEVIGGVRRVVRRVSNPFWVVREVLRYGKDCEAIAPEALRQKVKDEVRSLYKLYGMESET